PSSGGIRAFPPVFRVDPTGGPEGTRPGQRHGRRSRSVTSVSAGRVVAPGSLRVKTLRRDVARYIHKRSELTALSSPASSCPRSHSTSSPHTTSRTSEDHMTELLAFRPRTSNRRRARHRATGAHRPPR